MDAGSSPSFNYSEDYQSGALSFEVFFKNCKLISNCGYFQNYKHQLNSISRSSETMAKCTKDILNKAA